MGVRIQRFPVSNCCNKKARIKSSCKQTETSVTSSISQMVIRSPTLFQRCLLVDTTSRRGATSNQRWNNVVYFNLEIYNVKQRWINVDIKTLDNVETTLSFSTLIWTLLVNVEITLWKWPFLKRTKQIISNRIHGIRSFNYYFIIFFTLLPHDKLNMSKSTCKAAKII